MLGGFKNFVFRFGKKPKIEKKELKRISKSARKTKTPRVVVKKVRTQIGQEFKSRELKLVQLLEEVNQREKEVEKRASAQAEKEKYLSAREENINAQEKGLGQKRQEAEDLRKKHLSTLEKIAALSKEEAKNLLLKTAQKELVAWEAKKIEEAKEAIKTNEEELSQEILAEALRHGVTDYVAGYTVSSLQLPNDNIKGKIIGREGRNIRAFEQATGVEIELDESNEARISSFDSLRREIAKIALEKLIRDGRIQPSRIEEVVSQTKAQMDKILLEEGKKICQAVGVYHLPVEIVKMIGRYRYRFSFGQNLAIHTIEETKIAVSIAQELKADVKVVRLGCLLHDIGKVVMDEEGSHVDAGVAFLKRFRFPPKIIACIEEHHEDKPFSSVESGIVWIADAASGSRPGARYQAHEEYLKRMTKIEEICRSHKGVADVAAYQAGREIRVIVQPEEISDDQLTVLINEISRQLDEEAKWAGQIKITGIREVRVQATASAKNRD
ncbi:MAG: Rnase Y domain-containing protein [Candidatus Shapirobacteria bacterium]